MKLIKNLLSFALSVILVFAFSVVSFAESPPGKVEVQKQAVSTAVNQNEVISDSFTAVGYKQSSFGFAKNKNTSQPDNLFQSKEQNPFIYKIHQPPEFIRLE